MSLYFITDDYSIDLSKLKKEKSLETDNSCRFKYFFINKNNGNIDSVEEQVHYFVSSRQIQCKYYIYNNNLHQASSLPALIVYDNRGVVIKQVFCNSGINPTN